MIGTLVTAHQRRSVRRSVQVPCLVVRERDSRVIGSFGMDLSADGMLVKAHAPALTGEVVHVTFRLPRTRDWMGAPATIARVVHGRRIGDAGHCLGLEFDALGPKAARRLRATLQGVPPPLPHREPRIDYAASVHLAALS